RFLLGHHLQRDRHSALDVHGDVRDRPHRRLGCPLAGDDLRPLDAHWPPTPTLHGADPPGLCGDREAQLKVPGTYSAFCTCSRICSMMTFMSTALRVVSRSCDFDDSVFASRLSSCIRKSSRRPAGSLALRTRRTSWMWPESRSSSSSTSSRCSSI